MARKKKSVVVPILGKWQTLFKNITNLINLGGSDGVLVIFFPADGSPPQYDHNFTDSTRKYRLEVADFIDNISDEIREGGLDV